MLPWLGASLPYAVCVCVHTDAGLEMEKADNISSTLAMEMINLFDFVWQPPFQASNQSIVSVLKLHSSNEYIS